MLLIILFFSFMCFISIIFYDFSKNKSSFFGSYVTIFLILIYIITPLMITYFNLGHHPYFTEIYNSCKSECSFINFTIILLFSFFYAIGFFIFKTEKNYYIYCGNIKFEKKLMFFLLLISIVSFFLFIYMYGGLTYVLENTSRIRSGTDDNKNYLGAFFKLFTYYVSIVFFYQFYTYLKDKSKKNLIIFSLLFILLLFKATVDSGRGNFIQLFTGLIFMSIFFKDGKLPTFKIFSLIPIAVFIGLFGKVYLFQLFSESDISFADVNQSNIEKIDSIFLEFSHQYSTLMLSTMDSLGGTRYFMDYFVWAIKPLKILGYNIPDSISYYNTFKITGVWDSEIPPGVIGFGYYEGHLIGVAIVAVFSGMIVRFLNNIIVNTINSSVQNKALSYAILVVLCLNVPFIFLNSDLALFIQRFLIYIILFICLIAFKKVKIKY